MNVAELDQFAEEYRAAHARNIAVTGEEPDYFARYKIEILGRRLAGLKSAADLRILDFGTGIGNSLPHLAAEFPRARVTGLDVSQASLDLAQRRFPGVADLVRYDGEAIPLEAASFDLIFSACVFHHIEGAEHGRLFAQLRALLKPGGAMAIFEHNPLNPVTRHIVATCPFDANAVLIGARELRRRQQEAGFARVEVAYAGFFPAALKALRPLEPMLGWAPLGAQYYTLAWR